MTEAQKIARAKRQVEFLTGFYIHAGIFATVVAGLFLINLATDSDWWVQWVLIGWGLGLALTPRWCSAVWVIASPTGRCARSTG